MALQPEGIVEPLNALEERYLASTELDPQPEDLGRLAKEVTPAFRDITITAWAQ